MNNSIIKKFNTINNPHQRGCNRTIQFLNQIKSPFLTNRIMDKNKQLSSNSSNLSTFLSSIPSKQRRTNNITKLQKSIIDYNNTILNYGNITKKLTPINKIFYNSLINRSIRESKKNESILQDNKNETLLVSSLYNLPYLSPKKKNINLKIKKRFNNSVNNSNLISLNNSFSSNTNLSKSKINKSVDRTKYFNLGSYMKEKFYSDIDIRYNYKLKDIKFCHDSSIKDKIIKMKKVGIFWNRILDYCSPIINSKKYKYEQLGIKERQKLKFIKNNRLNKIFSIQNG